MTTRLQRGASGLRHVRWVLEIVASIQAHQKHNSKLSDGQRGALVDGLGVITMAKERLEKATVPYRSFLENALTEVRANQRVGDFLIDQCMAETIAYLTPWRAELPKFVPGGLPAFLGHAKLSSVQRAGRKQTVAYARTAALRLRELPAEPFTRKDELANALTKAADALDGFNREADALMPQREPLRAAVDSAVANLRETLAQVDGRLRTHFSEAFIESLYPELTRNNTKLAGDADEDDDAMAEPVVDAAG